MDEQTARRLMAHETHEHEGEQSPIEVTYTSDYGILIELTCHTAQIMPHYYTGNPSLSLLCSVHSLELDSVTALIALLQRAKEIMERGS